MIIKKELNKITETISSNELLNKIIKAYSEELQKDSEQEYQESQKILDSVLSEEQKQNLIRIEKLFTENMKYSLGFGFKRGIYAGFEQYFVSESKKEFFDKSVHDDLLTMPHMRKHTEYYKRRTEINCLVERIIEGLETTYQEHVTTVCCIYDEKNYGVLRYAFYIGYRYAFSLIEEMNPFGLANVIDKILYTEYDLGFIMTYAEKEQEKYKKSRQKDEEHHL